MNKHLLTIASLTLILASCNIQEPAIQTIPTAASSSSMISSKAVSDSRPACTPDDFLPRMEQSETWSTSWNSGEAMTTIALERPNKGFSVTIPYNPLWGNSDCQLSAYEEDEKTISFGFAGVFEGGGVMTFNRITVSPSRSAEQAITAITAAQEPDRKLGILPPGMEPKDTTINGNTAVQYFSGGFCDQTYFEVIGKKYNYVFSSICNVDEVGIKAALESLKLL